MSWMICPAYGRVESLGPCCLVCGGCGESASECAPPQMVCQVTEIRGKPEQRITHIVLALARSERRLSA